MGPSRRNQSVRNIMQSLQFCPAAGILRFPKKKGKEKKKEVPILRKYTTPEVVQNGCDSALLVLLRNVKQRKDGTNVSKKTVTCVTQFLCYCLFCVVSHYAEVITLLLLTAQKKAHLFCNNSFRVSLLKMKQTRDNTHSAMTGG